VVDEDNNILQCGECTAACYHVDHQSVAIPACLAGLVGSQLPCPAAECGPHPFHHRVTA
jgi:hypothetical protein